MPTDTSFLVYARRGNIDADPSRCSGSFSIAVMASAAAAGMFEYGYDAGRRTVQHVRVFYTPPKPSCRKSWTTQSHTVQPWALRAAVETVLLCGVRIGSEAEGGDVDVDGHGSGSRPPSLPLELWLAVLEHFGSTDFQASPQGGFFLGAGVNGAIKLNSLRELVEYHTKVGLFLLASIWYTHGSVCSG